MTDALGTVLLNVQVEGDDTVYPCAVEWVLPWFGFYSAVERTGEAYCMNYRIPFIPGQESYFWIEGPGQPEPRGCVPLQWGRMVHILDEGYAPLAAAMQLVVESNL